MTRADEIRHLQERYRALDTQHKRKAAAAVLLRLQELMRRQIKAEDRQDRKNHAKSMAPTMEASP
jgi:hypothetical protein